MAHQDPPTINLKERFGDRFKVEYEESYYTERSRRTVERICCTSFLSGKFYHPFFYGEKPLRIDNGVGGKYGFTVASNLA